LMDEPTTHLDIASIDALIHALKSYEGTLIFISHDVHFIRALAENVLHVHSGRLTPYAGNYDYYLEKSRAGAARAALTAGFTDARPARPAPAAAAAPRPPKRSAGELRKFRERVGQLEKAVTELEAKQAEITAALEAPETYADKGRFHHLNRELSTIVDQLGEATTAWEKAASELEEMERGA
ncbi:MAG: ABC transporter ATP-binding protein, partial [Opitutaceae bacterium]